MNQVTLYSKPGCHLCESVEQVIQRVAKRRAFSFKTINILDDPAAMREYEFEIPVVKLNGREIARHRMDSREFELALQNADKA